jgi:hypothetical protein
MASGRSKSKGDGKASATAAAAHIPGVIENFLDFLDADVMLGDMLHISFGVAG